MRTIGLALLLASASVSVGAEDAKSITPADVEEWEEFAKARLTELEEVRVKKLLNPETVPLPDEVVEEGENKMRELGRRLGIPITQQFQWYHHHSSTSVYHRLPDRSYFSLWFEKGGREVRAVRLFDLPILDEIESRVTPDLFEEFARGFYLKAFGESPSGNAAFQWDGEGIHRFGKERASWGVMIDGVLMKKGAGFSVDRDANEKWTVFCSKGPTRWEAERMRGLLKKRPVALSEREAIAIAWKNWKSVRKEGYEKGQFQIMSLLREVKREELEPWGTATMMIAEQRAWKNPKADLESSDLIYYNITFHGGLFTVDVMVDRETGAVVRMHQGRMSW